MSDVIYAFQFDLQNPIAAKAAEYYPLPPPLVENVTNETNMTNMSNHSENESNATSDYEPESINKWRFATVDGTGRMIHDQTVDGYTLEPPANVSNTSSGPVQVFELFEAAAFVPSSVDADSINDICAGFRLRSRACLSPYGCEIHIYPPPGFLPETEFCGRAFQRGTLVNSGRCMSRRLQDVRLALFVESLLPRSWEDEASAACALRVPHRLT